MKLLVETNQKQYAPEILNEQLVTAIHLDDLEYAKLCVKLGADVKSTTAARALLFNGSKQMCQWMYQQGALFSYHDDELGGGLQMLCVLFRQRLASYKMLDHFMGHATPVFKAAMFGGAEELNRCSNRWLETCNGFNIAHYLAARGRNDLLKLVLDVHPVLAKIAYSPNASKLKFTPLAIAIMNDQQETIKFLEPLSDPIDEGAAKIIALSGAKRQIDKMSPLAIANLRAIFHYAIHYGKMDLAAFILRKKPSILRPRAMHQSLHTNNPVLIQWLANLVSKPDYLQSLEYSQGGKDDAMLEVLKLGDISSAIILLIRNHPVSISWEFVRRKHSALSKVLAIQKYGVARWMLRAGAASFVELDSVMNNNHIHQDHKSMKDVIVIGSTLNEKLITNQTPGFADAICTVEDLRKRLVKSHDVIDREFLRMNCQALLATVYKEDRAQRKLVEDVLECSFLTCENEIKPWSLKDLCAFRLKFTPEGQQVAPQDLSQVPRELESYVKYTV